MFSIVPGAHNRYYYIIIRLAISLVHKATAVVPARSANGSPARYTCAVSCTCCDTLRNTHKMGRKDKGSADKKRDGEEAAAAAAPKQKKAKQAAKAEEEEMPDLEVESADVEDFSEGDEGEVGST